MGHTNMKLKHHRMKRGPRYRQERRQLKRIGIPMTTVLDAAEFSELAAAVATGFGEMVDKARETAEQLPKFKNLFACPVCGKYGDNPCVTKTGNKAKQNHAARP